MGKILDKIKNTRILALIGIICSILGTMVTYVKFTISSFFGEISESFTLWDFGAGKIVIIIAIVNLLLIFKDFVEKYVPALFNTNIGKKVANINNPKLSLIPTIIMAILTMHIHSEMDIVSEYASYGLGFYSIWIGIICLVAYAILHKNND